jgi:hypothetical protein
MAPLLGVNRRSAPRHGARATAVGVALWMAASGCDPTVSIGVRVCPSSPDASDDLDAAVDASIPVQVPWRNGFEDGFCDYAMPAGFCLATGSNSYDLVTSPVHSGRFAAAFTANTNTADAGTQARCVRQGVFPTQAYYGAWYYIPPPDGGNWVNTGNWNLLDFRGGTPGPEGGTLGFWDVSITSLTDGGLNLYLFDFFTAAPVYAGTPLAVPIGRWFHVEVFFKRSSGNAGELAVWQDSTKLLDVQNIETDNSDWGQWYVGNLASALQPPVSTVYVDDITIDSVP